MISKLLWKTITSNNIFCLHLSVGLCVCMCVLGVLVLGLSLYKNVKRKTLILFPELFSVNIVGENYEHLLYAEFSFVSWNDEENNNIHDNTGVDKTDYICPSWIGAFDVCCIFVGGVIRWGRETKRGSDSPLAQSFWSYTIPPPPLLKQPLENMLNIKLLSQ